MIFVVFSYALLRRFALSKKDIRVINDEFNLHATSYLEYLWLSYLRSTDHPLMESAHHSSTKLPRFANAIPDGYYRSQNGLQMFWFQGK